MSRSRAEAQIIAEALRALNELCKTDPPFIKAAAVGRELFKQTGGDSLASGRVLANLVVILSLADDDPLAAIDRLVEHLRASPLIEDLNKLRAQSMTVH